MRSVVSLTRPKSFRLCLCDTDALGEASRMAETVRLWLEGSEVGSETYGLLHIIRKTSSRWGSLYGSAVTLIRKHVQNATTERFENVEFECLAENRWAVAGFEFMDVSVLGSRFYYRAGIDFWDQTKRFRARASWRLLKLKKQIRWYGASDGKPPFWVFSVEKPNQKRYSVRSIRWDHLSKTIRGYSKDCF